MRGLLSVAAISGGSDLRHMLYGTEARMAGLLSPRPQLVSHSHTCSSVSSAHANTYFVFWYVHSVPWQLVRRRCLAAGRCCRMAGMPASFPASEPTGWGWWRPHQLQQCRGSGKHITAPSEAQARYVAAHAVPARPRYGSHLPHCSSPHQCMATSQCPIECNTPKPNSCDVGLPQLWDRAGL